MLDTPFARARTSRLFRRYGGWHEITMLFADDIDAIRWCRNALKGSVTTLPSASVASSYLLAVISLVVILPPRNIAFFDAAIHQGRYKCRENLPAIRAIAHYRLVKFSLPARIAE